MIKKAKLLSIFFSASVLSMNLQTVSCGKTTSDSVTTATSTTVEEKSEINSEIKDFIKNNITPQGNQSILTVDSLLEETSFVGASHKKRAKINETINFLDKLSDDLNKNTADEDFKLELKNNKIVEEGIKQIIHNNCVKTADSLKKKYEDEFAQVNKILEIDEDSLIISLKKFSLSRIFRDIEFEDKGFDDQGQEFVFAESDKLKIYNVSVDLKVFLTNGSSNKNSIDIKDINFFITLNQEKTELFQKGITEYLQNKFTQNTISIYLDDQNQQNPKGTSSYFPRIIKNKDYDLFEGDNKKQIMTYFSNFYLPALIYKNNSKEQQSIIIGTTDIIEKNLNFCLEGMKMLSNLNNQITFSNFFGNNGQVQIQESDIEKITADLFLKDTTVHEKNYYTLGSATLVVANWHIKGFPISNIKLKFKIYIKKEILENEIISLRVALKNVLNVMKTSRLDKLIPTELNSAGKYAFRIYTGVNSENTKNKLTDEMSFDQILNTLYIDPAKENSNKQSFNTNFNNVSFKFFTTNGHLTFRADNSRKFKYLVTKNSSRENEPLNIYFMFNSSFKIKLSDGLCVERTKNQVADSDNNKNNEDQNHQFYIR